MIDIDSMATDYLMLSIWPIFSNYIIENIEHRFHL